MSKGADFISILSLSCDLSLGKCFFDNIYTPLYTLRVYCAPYSGINLFIVNPLLKAYFFTIGQTKYHSVVYIGIYVRQPLPKRKAIEVRQRVGRLWQGVTLACLVVEPIPSEIFVCGNSKFPTTCRSSCPVAYCLAPRPRNQRILGSHPRMSYRFSQNVFLNKSFYSHPRVKLPVKNVTEVESKTKATHVRCCYQN